MTRFKCRSMFTVPAFALLAAVAPPAIAAEEDAAAVRQDLAITRADIQADRKAIVAASLELTDAQAKAFWPLYDAYRAEAGALGDRTQEIILEYAKEWNAKSLTDAKASSLLDRWLDVRENEVTMQKKWSKKMRAEIPGIVVSRFMQVENRLNLIVMLEVASAVPLMQAPAAP